MATLTTDEMEYVILGYHEYKHVWSPEINESLATVGKTRVSHESHAKSL